jgi:hypothetical protein
VGFVDLRCGGARRSDHAAEGRDRHDRDAARRGRLPWIHAQRHHGNFR